MTIKQRLKEKLRAHYLVPQNTQWMRTIDALAAVLCFVSAIIALYLLNTTTELRLSTILNLVAWIYFIVAPFLAYWLYQESSLKKYERALVVLFLLSSAINLLRSVEDSL